MNEDPHQDLFWKPNQAGNFARSMSARKPGILLNRKRVMSRLTEAPW